MCKNVLNAFFLENVTIMKTTMSFNISPCYFQLVLPLLNFRRQNNTSATYYVFERMKPLRQSKLVLFRKTGCFNVDNLGFQLPWTVYCYLQRLDL